MSTEYIRDRMKHLSSFGQRVFAFNFRGQLFFIAESGSLEGDSVECKKDYFLFDEKTHIGNLYLARKIFSKAESDWDKERGAVIIPDETFYLDQIEILKPEQRGKALGSALFNWTIKDMQKFSEENDKELPLYFVKWNNETAKSFYDKWGAVTNQNPVDDEYGSSCYMLIENPEPKDEYQVSIVAKYDKPITKEERYK